MTRTRGDLVLYRSSGRWYERLITLATHGPFVHVAIVVDPRTVIAARTRGIGYEDAPPEDEQHVTLSLAGRTDAAGIEQGLTWARAQAGRAYGWSDIVYQALKALWPQNPLRLSVAGQYDCSDFVCRYLLQAGVALPPAFDDPSTITPNDLARWGGILPGDRM